MFCRMDWSPDGAYLVVPSSMNNAGPTAHLIRRKVTGFFFSFVKKGFHKCVILFAQNFTF